MAGRKALVALEVWRTLARSSDQVEMNWSHFGPAQLAMVLRALPMLSVVISPEIATEPCGMENIYTEL